MATPSNRTGIASLPMVVLVVVILFLGLVLAPRAFEFHAWPEPARHDAIEAIVNRTAPEAIEVRVARPHAERNSDALAVRGTAARHATSPRGAGADHAGTLDARATRHGRAARPGARGHAAPPVLAHSPAPAPQATTPTPDKPAQLAASPTPGPVLRPEAQVLPPSTVPEPLREERPGGCREHGHSGDED